MLKRFLLLLCFFKLEVLTLDAGAHAQLSSLKNQIPSSWGEHSIIMDHVELIKNFEMGPKNDHLVAKEAGIYFVIASGQMGTTRENVIGNLDLWCAKNDIAIPNSNCRQSFETSGSTSILISQFVVNLLPGDKISTWFATSRPFLGFVCIKPKSEPVIPSVLLSIYKIDGGSL